MTRIYTNSARKRVMDRDVYEGPKEVMQERFDQAQEMGYRVESSVDGGRSIRMVRWDRGYPHRIELNVKDEDYLGQEMDR